MLAQDSTPKMPMNYTLFLHGALPQQEEARSGSVLQDAQQEDLSDTATRNGESRALEVRPALAWHPQTCNPFPCSVMLFLGQHGSLKAEGLPKHLPNGVEQRSSAAFL